MLLNMIAVYKTSFIGNKKMSLFKKKKKILVLRLKEAVG